MTITHDTFDLTMQIPWPCPPLPPLVLTSGAAEARGVRKRTVCMLLECFLARKMTSSTISKVEEFTSINTVALQCTTRLIRYKACDGNTYRSVAGDLSMFLGDWCLFCMAVKVSSCP